jgi:tetratricopeptide (TPR) repeat protein
MQTFTRGLGVQCTYCHIQATEPLLTPEEAQAQAAAQAAQGAAGRGRGRGRGGPQIDFASDDKRTKQTARVMMRLVNDINARLGTSLSKPAADVAKVECATCHRGITNPKLLPDLLWDTMMGKGEGAAMAMYRDLKQRYTGTQAYDFSEPVLVALAERSLAVKKPDDALAWLQLSLETYPKSVASYVLLSQVHVLKRDPDAALKDIEKALAIDPASDAAKRQRRALKK